MSYGRQHRPVGVHDHRLCDRGRHGGRHQAAARVPRPAAVEVRLLGARAREGKCRPALPEEGLGTGEGSEPSCEAFLR